MTPDSFTFGRFNSLDDWGIRIITYDVLTPEKRERKTEIPRRSGLYNHGHNVWNERIISIDCTLERKISRESLREIAYALSRRAELRLWQEPDKYYIGEIYTAPDITDYMNESMREFTLEFICEPFAFSAARSEPLKDGKNRIKYNGTMENGAIFEIRNPNSYTVSNITLTSTRKRR